jgi:hypothetical protein
MPDDLILTNLDHSEQAERIMDAFEERTGLRGEAVTQGRFYDLEVVQEEVEVVQTLTAIDPTWTEHVGFAAPD